MIQLLNLVLLCAIVLLSVLKANGCGDHTPWYDKIAWYLTGVGAFSSVVYRDPSTFSDLFLNTGIVMLLFAAAYPQLRHCLCRKTLQNDR